MWMWRHRRRLGAIESGTTGLGRIGQPVAVVVKTIAAQRLTGFLWQQRTFGHRPGLTAISAMSLVRPTTRFRYLAVTAGAVRIAAGALTVEKNAATRFGAVRVTITIIVNAVATVPFGNTLNPLACRIVAEKSSAAVRAYEGRITIGTSPGGAA